MVWKTGRCRRMSPGSVLMVSGSSGRSRRLRPAVNCRNGRPGRRLRVKVVLPGTTARKRSAVAVCRPPVLAESGDRMLNGELLPWSALNLRAPDRFALSHFNVGARSSGSDGDRPASLKSEGLLTDCRRNREVSAEDVRCIWRPDRAPSRLIAITGSGSCRYLIVPLASIHLCRAEEVRAPEPLGERSSALPASSDYDPWKCFRLTRFLAEWPVSLEDGVAGVNDLCRPFSPSGNAFVA